MSRKASMVGVLAILVAMACSAWAPRAFAKDPPEKRNFYDVLEDLLGDFEYDLKNGQVSGLKDLSIRNIASSENVPGSFKNHLELVLAERMMKNAKVRIIQCLPCRSKRTTVSGDNVVITSADTNPAELARIAKVSGIANFMDVAFAYQPTGMILSMYITDPETGAIVWSRSYNSETTRAAAFRRGVDFSQIDDARRNVEYRPTLMYHPAISYYFQPNFTGLTGELGLGFRLVERYDNRKKEVGFELNYMLDIKTLVGDPTAATSNLWSTFNLTLLFVHCFNFIGQEENFNAMRGSLFVGVGGTYASGFLGALIRAGYEWRMAKYWGVNVSLGYRPAATAFISGTSAGTVSGVEIGFGVGANF